MTEGFRVQVTVTINSEFQDADHAEAVLDSLIDHCKEFDPWVSDNVEGDVTPLAEIRDTAATDFDHVDLLMKLDRVRGLVTRWRKELGLPRDGGGGVTARLRHLFLQELEEALDPKR